MQKELKILLVTSIFLNLAAGLFVPIYALYVESIGGDLIVAGMAYAIFAVVTGLLIFVVGKWEDHFKHQEKLIIWGRFLSLLGVLGFLIIDSPGDLYLVQLILGVGTAISTPAFQSVYSKHLDKGKFASEWGTWNSWTWIVGGVSGLLGGFVANTFGFEVLFMIMSGMGFISLVASFWLLKK